MNGGWAIYLNSDNLTNSNISSNTIGGNTTNGVFMRDLTNATIAPASGQIQVGNQLKPLANPLYVEYGSNITVTGLDLWSTTAVGGGITMTSVNGLTVTNNSFRNRINGLNIQYSSNITATGNDLTDSGVNGGWAIYLNSDNLTNSNISSNTIGGNTTSGVFMRDLTNATIAPASGQIQVGNQLKPLANPLYVEYGSNITVTGLDLWSTTAVGGGILMSSVNGLTVTNNSFRNRINGLNIQYSSNITATGNDLTDSGVNGGWAIYLNSDSGTLTVNSNTLAGASTNGLYLGYMSNYTVSDGSAVGTNITIPDGSVLKTMTGTSVYIVGGSGIWVENLDLENTGSNRVGTGIRVDNSGGFTAARNTMIRRTTGILINNDGVNGATLTCNHLKNNTTAIVFSGAGNSSNTVSNNAIWANTMGLNNATYPGQLINATSNWWGQTAGPVTGSTSGTGITTTPFSATVPACVPVSCPATNDWVTIAGSLTMCFGASTTLTASGAGTVIEGESLDYLWSTGETTATISVSLGQVYSVTATNPVGCTVTATASVTGIPSLTITATPGLTIDQGQTITLTAMGGVDSFSWSNGISTSTISVTTAGVYSVTGTSNGCSATATAEVRSTQPIAPTCDLTVDISRSAEEICENVTLSLTALAHPSKPPVGTEFISGRQARQATPTLTYRWLSPQGAGLNSSSSQDVIASFTSSGVKTFTVIVTDANNCTATNTVRVTVKPLPTVTIVFPQSATVSPGPVVTVPVGTGLTYQVLGGVQYNLMIVIDRVNGFEIRTVKETADGIFPLDWAGPYTITVTGANGCQRTVTGVIVGR